MQNIRSAVFLAYLFVATTLVAVIGLPAPVFSERAARAVIQIWARIILGGLKVICGITYRIEGAENIPEGGAIVASNHQSMWETIALFAFLTKPVAVFKRELLSIPVYGWWGLRAGSVAIDRRAGIRSIRAMTKHAALKIEEGAQIIVFPEGTRVAAGTIAPLQPGVAAIYLAAGARVTPVAHDSGRFWRHPGWMKVPGVITVRFLSAIEPGLDRKTFLATLASKIEAARPDLATSAERCAAAPGAAAPLPA